MSIFFRAVFLSLGAALFSGVNGFLTKAAVSEVGDPVVFTFLKNAIVSLIFFGVFLWFRKSNEIREASSRDKRLLFLIGIVGGGIPFLLYFSGLSMIPAATAVFIHKTLFLWVAMLAVPFLGERVDWLHAFALGLLLFGVLLFQVPVWHSFGLGEVLVLLATILWAVENILAKKVLHHISSLSAMSARMILGSVVIFCWLVLSGKVGIAFSLSWSAWGWTFLTSLLLVGYVSCWYRALSLAPAGFVASLLVPAAFITGALSSIFVTGTISASSLAGWLSLALGIALLSWKVAPLFPKGREHQLLRVPAGRSV
ncbi:MAG: DMT family transporter [Candidatus Moraniibacteriota bacterium]|nr:MAG: DMT family transporter [Candidatus Moranbacteria bacterium]